MGFGVSVSEKEINEISELKNKISNLFSNLIRHPVLNTTYFLHEEQEALKKTLKSIQVGSIQNNNQFNAVEFMDLYHTQLKCLLDDFESLVKVKDGTATNLLIVSSNNFLNEPFGELENNDFSVQHSTVVLVNRIKFTIASLRDINMQFVNLYSAVNGIIPNFLSSNLIQLNNEIENFRRLRSIADNAKTEDIYHNAVEKYKKLEKKYRKYFYRTLPIVIFIAICMFLGKKALSDKFGIDEPSYWVLKISILFIGVTIISYFLKQSIHYQRLADQNYQTQVELQAYPSFMESIPTEEAASVRRELALKYFGREINGAAHKDMSNLISDQMKSTTDMVKATTEAIKNLK